MEKQQLAHESRRGVASLSQGEEQATKYIYTTTCWSIVNRNIGLVVKSYNSLTFIPNLASYVQCLLVMLRVCMYLHMYVHMHPGWGGCSSVDFTSHLPCHAHLEPVYLLLFPPLGLVQPLLPCPCGLCHQLLALLKLFLQCQYLR